jgi:hypothetical protein
VTFDTDTRRARLRSDLEAARGEFHEMVASISAQGWTEPSQNPSWTNGQVLFKRNILPSTDTSSTVDPSDRSATSDSHTSITYFGGRSRSLAASNNIRR